MNLDKYIQIFFGQVEEYLQEIYQILSTIEREGTKDNLVNQLMSDTHSLKGMARTIGFSGVEELCHGLENVIKRLSSQNQWEANNILPTLIEGFALLEQLVENLKSNSEEKIPYREFLSRLNSLPLFRAQNEFRLISPIDLSPKLKNYTHAQVRTEILDRLLNLISEALVFQNRLRSISKKFNSRELRYLISQLNDLIKELYLQISIARIMPIKILTERLSRLAKNLAKEQNKEIEWMVEGEHLEFDRGVLEALEEPLIHLIRNAVDHGIEKPAEREKKQKPRRGKINLNIARIKESLVLQLEDDGKGIDLELIKEKALKTGIITSEEGKIISREEILKLIFLPNLSTAETVTEISGRGQGMFIVANKIKGLGGSIEVFSQKDQGSKFQITLPLKLYILPAFIVRVGDFLISLPVTKVISSTQVLNQKIFSQNYGEAIMFRNSLIPVYSLHRLLKIESPPLEEKGYLSLIIIEVSKNQTAALIVDNFVGQEEIIIRPLKPPLNHLQAFSGISLLEDGRITFLLDLEALISFSKQINLPYLFPYAG